MNNAPAKSARVYVLARLFGGTERHYGVVQSEAPRAMLRDGVGDIDGNTEPHVRVLFDGSPSPVWEAVSTLRAARK